MLCVATYTVRSTAQSIATKEGLSLLNQIISWFTLCKKFYMLHVSFYLVLVKIFKLWYMYKMVDL